MNRHPDIRPGERAIRDPDRRFYGRRRGPRLSARQQRLLADRLPDLRIAPERLAGAAGNLDPATLFDRPMRGFALEIGFGKGEHLAARAAAEPDLGLLGAEPYLNGVVGLLDRIVCGGIENIRIHPDDARDLLEALAPASLEHVWLLHPDPWPKRRHARRRFINPAGIDLVARVLRPGGLFTVVSDDPVYIRWTAMRMSARSDFEWQALGPDDWRRPPADWVETRYARKAAAEGRADVFFRYRRC
ncbi:MAG: tRNA (guanosine(46)-N7)-methyltransferase TrmB [Alphaproteobacteria bacterium]|nr:MAG: tRNA (guanosine(46)-N7)-methyltransferase TrmB [Alphaproteobacteria bacterium]